MRSAYSVNHARAPTVRGEGGHAVAAQIDDDTRPRDHRHRPAADARRGGAAYILEEVIEGRHFGRPREVENRLPPPRQGSHERKGRKNRASREGGKAGGDGEHYSSAARARRRGRVP